MVRYLNQQEAKQLDQQLFENYKFSIDQLMELAGFSISQIIHSYHPTSKCLILCGPGNNGGDGLVASRHLSHFNHQVTVYYPVKGKTELFERLVTQSLSNGVKFTDDFNMEGFDLIIDALFGFSFHGPLREPFKSVITKLSNSKIPIISVDIPSGWDVDDGPINDPILTPNILISLSAPKLCSKSFNGIHYLGGRFIPKEMSKEWDLDLPEFIDTLQYVEI